ncbi:scavenger receptor cysteine-rich type 1 protein M130-like [Gambusia affinis]|uniref:scavenger receptor cysteine-rich type 1 protein M130-like n=1 Tax=Gambusia affinis TaxID=33528 RepID=UPI001CDB6F2E|nr:scavenger receptor cysteine-rich type 1 protein M130-like [Gambusia affinis]
MFHQEEWRPVDAWGSYWNMNSAAVVCTELDCGSVVSAKKSTEASKRPVWEIRSECFKSESALKNCLPDDENSDRRLEFICSDSVRLVQGTNRCSGRLEVKTNQSWSSVCEKDFDLQDAKVVCREIGCGSPLVHQGALYGEVEAPLGSREVLCEGSESALLNCSSRKSSGRNSCSPGQAVGLTCSGQDSFRLVGECSQCAGRLEMKHQKEWRPVDVWDRYWDMNSASAVCAELDCGSAVSVRKSKEASERPVWWMSSDCSKSGSGTKNCLLYDKNSDRSHEFICSDSVRLVQGTNRCSGRLEVKTDQSWSSVCEKDFDLQDAKVVCREIGCGPPSVLQGALYREAEAPVGSREFLCEGSESALLKCCSRKSSGRNSCSPGQAVGLTCSAPLRLVGEASRCAGILEMLHQEEWRPVVVSSDYWNMNSVAVVCAELDCGSAVSARNSKEDSVRPVWWIRSDCFQSGSALKNCLPDDKNSDQSHEFICSGLLVEPLIFLSSSTDGVSTGRKQGSELLIGSGFSIMCSIRPQYEGGSFQLIFSTSNYTQNHTLPAVNHSALFLFSAAGHAHQGTYRCVYHVYVFSYNFSSMSQPLNLTVSVSASLTALIISVVVVLLGLLGSVLVLYFKARRNQKSGPENNHHDEGSRAEGSLEEETAV